MTQTAHKLDRYRLAVQHPDAECAFLQRVYEHYFPGQWATRLREDFSGTCAISAAWVTLDDDHRALAIDHHGPTARWADRFLRRHLGQRADDVLLYEADVCDITSPRCDITAALNFSALAFHDRPGLHHYLKHARKSLARQGLLVLDVFGGPGAMRPQTQTRLITPRPHEGIPPFGYQWEQRKFDPIQNRLDCRIHFPPPGSGPGRLGRGAFHYDWRLWSLPELTELMREAGFADAQVWCDTFDPAIGQSDGLYQPAPPMNGREDWVAYVVGVKRPRQSQNGS